MPVTTLIRRVLNRSNTLADSDDAGRAAPPNERAPASPMPMAATTFNAVDHDAGLATTGRFVSNFPDNGPIYEEPYVGAAADGDFTDTSSLSDVDRKMPIVEDGEKDAIEDLARLESQVAEQEQAGLQHGQPARNAGFLRSFSNVVCIIIGTGCLQIPYAFAKAGWIGVIIVVLSAFIGGYTGVLTIKCLYYQEGQRLHSFPQIGRAAFGKYGQYATQFFNYLYSLGTTCLYIILAGQFIYQLVSTLGVDLSKKVWMILVALIMWIPVAILKEMSEAAIMAIFGLLASVVVIAVATIMSVANPYTKMYPSEPAPGDDIAIAIGIPVALSSIVFSYSGSVVYPHVEASMKKPKQWPNVIYTSMAFCAAAYLMIGVSGYWAYGTQVVSPVLDSIPAGAPATIAKIMITLHVIIAAPIMLLTFFLEVELAWKINAERLGKKREFIVRLVFRSVIVALVCAVALAIPYFADFLALISSIACVTMFAILPIVCYLKLYGHKIAPWYEKFWMVIVLVIGIVASVWGSVDAVKSLIRDVQEGASS
ncbi:hypothetical protein GGF42_007232 [Coemansia sp. RSA 2424]|nr:hypothetical protein GGF42_007232 [Coemansia sp. RSA 2424]